MIVTMSRYSTTSASSQSRPWPGITSVPPSCFSSGTVSAMMRFSAAMTPSMPPPSSGRITGYPVVVKTSPVLTTSERRKNTRLSPSVCAAGWCRICDGLAVEEEVFLRHEQRTVGHASNGGGASWPDMRTSTFSCAMTAAPSPASAIAPETLPPAIVLPDFAISSLPPT